MPDRLSNVTRGWPALDIAEERTLRGIAADSYIAYHCVLSSSYIVVNFRIVYRIVSGCEF